MIVRQIVEQRKQSVLRRLAAPLPDQDCGPVLNASNIEYELADRTRAIHYGGIGLIHQLAQQSGLVEALDRNLQHRQWKTRTGLPWSHGRCCAPPRGRHTPKTHSAFACLRTSERSKP